MSILYPQNQSEEVQGVVYHALAGAAPKNGILETQAPAGAQRKYPSSKDRHELPSILRIARPYGPEPLGGSQNASTLGL